MPRLMDSLSSGVTVAMGFTGKDYVGLLEPSKVLEKSARMPLKMAKIERLWKMLVNVIVLS